MTYRPIVDLASQCTQRRARTRWRASLDRSPWGTEPAGGAESRAHQSECNAGVLRLLTGHRASGTEEDEGAYSLDNAFARVLCSVDTCAALKFH